MKSVLQLDTSVCFVCMRRGSLECHHVFEGTANRKKSEADGMKIYVHRACHMWIHEHPASAYTLKKRAQAVWESRYGSPEDFVKRYGWDYIRGGMRK